MGTVSMIVYILLSVTSHDNLIADAFTSLSLTIAFYYGITGFACVVFYRKHLFDSVKNFVMIGVLPFVGGLILTWVLIKAVIDYSKADGGYAKPFLGIGSPIAIALLTIILGLVAMLYQRITDAGVLQTQARGRRSGGPRRRAGGALVMSSGIIVGYDGSDYAKAALRTALEVGKAYGDKVTIAFGYDLNPVAGEVKDYAAALRELARQAGRGGDRHGGRREQAPRSRRRSSSAPPAEALADLAEERDARADRGRHPRREPASRRIARLDGAQAAAPRATGRCWSCRRPGTDPTPMSWLLIAGELVAGAGAALGQH